MTDLADRIAALTRADDHLTLRMIEAEVADLIGWWPENAERGAVNHHMRLLFNGKSIPYGTLKSPAFTVSLDATEAEIVRRGWYFSIGNIDPTSTGAFANIWPNGFDYIGQALRSDEIVALAACEALVRAVESIAATPLKMTHNAYRNQRGQDICAMWKETGDVRAVATRFKVQPRAVYEQLRKAGLLPPYQPAKRAPVAREMTKDTYTEMPVVYRDPCFKCGVRGDVGCKHLVAV